MTNLSRLAQLWRTLSDWQREWGGESSAKLRLARTYLAAHFGTMSLRGDTATGPAASKSAGPISISYGTAMGGGSNLYANTNAGLMFLSLVQSLPARAPMVI